MSTIAKMAGRVVTVGMLGGFGLILKDFSEKERSYLHDFSSAANQYLVYNGMKLLSSYCRKKFEEDCSRGPQVNEELLLQLLSKNKDTEYGIKYDFDKIVDRHFYQRVHPLTKHEHYDQYMKRMIKGEKNILVKDELKMFAETSGTSGSRKLLPVTADQRKVFFLNGLTVVFDEMFKAFPQCMSLQRSLKLMYVPSYSYTANGLRIGPNSSTPGDSKSTMYLYTTPEVAYCTENEQEMLFLHALFALADDRLGHIEANFIFYVFNLMTFIHEHWASLAACIEQGKLDRSQLRSVSEENIDAIENLLRANPDRANSIRSVSQQAFVEGNFEKINTMKALWPSLNMILSSETGSFKLYGERLRTLYMGKEATNHVPIYSPIYAASEGLIGINVDARGKNFVLVPRAMFFEFIPIEESNKENPETKFVDEVEVGKVYELVITNLCGLYRYRFGDVIKVTGMYGNMPEIEIMYRQGQILDIRGEKTSEKMLTDAVSQMASQWKACRLVDFTSVEQGNQRGAVKKPKYEIYMEIAEVDQQVQPQSKWQSKICQHSEQFDEALQNENDIYALFRRKGMLHKPEVKLVKPGTFEKIRKQLIQNGSSASQVKIPRVARHPTVVRTLHENSLD